MEHVGTADIERMIVLDYYRVMDMEQPTLYHRLGNYVPGEQLEVICEPIYLADLADYIYHIIRLPAPPVNTQSGSATGCLLRVHIEMAC